MVKNFHQDFSQIIWSELNLLKGLLEDRVSIAMASVKILCKVETLNELMILSLSMSCIKFSLGEFLVTLCGDFKYWNSLWAKILFKRVSLVLTNV